MTTKGFVATHARDAAFTRGLRSLHVYRDLAIHTATDGRVAAHVIRAAAGFTTEEVPAVNDASSA